MPPSNILPFPERKSGVQEVAEDFKALADERKLRGAVVLMLSDNPDGSARVRAWWGTEATDLEMAGLLWLASHMCIGDFLDASDSTPSSGT